MFITSAIQTVRNIKVTRLIHSPREYLKINHPPIKYNKHEWPISVRWIVIGILNKFCKESLSTKVLSVFPEGFMENINDEK